MRSALAPVAGIVPVGRAGIRTAKQLEAWVERGVDFARTLPGK